MSKSTKGAGTVSDGGRATEEHPAVPHVLALLAEAEAGLARTDTSDPADCPYWRGRIEMAKDVLTVLGRASVGPCAPRARERRR